MLLDNLNGVNSKQIEKIVAAFEDEISPCKGLWGDGGMLFLANDSNKFLSYLCGSLQWDEKALSKAQDIIYRRISHIKHLGAHYLKFIIPEKTAFYSEYLPKPLSALARVKARPAELLSNNQVFYLDKCLRQVKSLGLLYFRGDTHPNWLGAFHIYIGIIRRLAAEGIADPNNIFGYADFVPSLASYQGDLYTQLNQATKAELKKIAGVIMPSNGYDITIKYDLKRELMHARQVPSPKEYTTWFKARETLVYESENKRLPRAVIFRDSTCDFVHPMLAQHFGRSVFVWHGGRVVHEVIEQEKPDVVLHIMAERFVSLYPQMLPICHMTTGE